LAAVLFFDLKILSTGIISALWHETGHLLMLFIFGVRISKVRITVFGAAIQSEYQCLSRRKKMLVLLAGPIFSLLLSAILFYMCYQKFKLMLFLSAAVNLTLGLVNLLPVIPLDGGNILALLFTDACTLKRINRCICTGLILLSGLLFIFFGNYSLLLFTVYLIIYRFI